MYHIVFCNVLQYLTLFEVNICCDIYFSINGIRTGGQFKNVNFTTDSQHHKKLKSID